MNLAWIALRRPAAWALACSLFLSFAHTDLTQAQNAEPFAALVGWWGGEGRLRFKDGKTEEVKCRATYLIGDTPNDLKQTIRCASGSGKIEVMSKIKHDAGKLSGDWVETVYNISGEMSGEVTPRGYRVRVKGTSGSTLGANMDIIVRENRQIVELQFFSETLIGLTLLLKKG